jgi:hypothetical protein
VERSLSFHHEVLQLADALCRTVFCSDLRAQSLDDSLGCGSLEIVPMNRVNRGFNPRSLCSKLCPVAGWMRFVASEGGTKKPLISLANLNRHKRR